MGGGGLDGKEPVCLTPILADRSRTINLGINPGAHFQCHRSSPWLWCGTPVCAPKKCLAHFIKNNNASSFLKLHGERTFCEVGCRWRWRRQQQCRCRFFLPPLGVWRQR